MAKLIAKYLLSKLLFLGWLLVIWSPPFLLMKVVPHESGNIPRIISGILVFWVLGGLVASWWLGNRTAHYLVDKHLLFLDAVKRTWLEARVRLAFIPIVGTWLTPDKDKTNDEDDDDIHSHSVE